MLPHWSELIFLPEEQLAELDVAAVNLACADGLPGAPSPDQAAECLDRLDHYARAAAHYTSQRLPDFHARPDYYDRSEGKFRVVMMVSVLQKLFGVRYHPDKIAADAHLATADVFVHGPLLGAGGTCASLPVVYAAVARRMGYPLRLVGARQHLFGRWEGQGERFNVEVNENGVDAPADDYYRAGRYFVSSWVEERHGYLRTQSPREEAAGFLAQRACLWLDLGKHRLGLESLAHSCGLAPHNGCYQDCLRVHLRQWRDRLDALVPPNFPLLKVNYERRRYPWLTEPVEREMVCFEATERVLAEPKHAGWWEDLRRSPGDRPRHVPTEIELCAGT